MIGNPNVCARAFEGHACRSVHLCATKGEQVVAETLAGKGNFTSATRLSADEALEAGKKFVGPGYSEIGKPGSGVFRSTDGTRQFRMDSNSLTGSHAPGEPHVHFEIYEPSARFPGFVQSRLSDILR